MLKRPDATSSAAALRWGGIAGLGLWAACSSNASPMMLDASGLAGQTAVAMMSATATGGSAAGQAGGGAPVATSVGSGNAGTAAMTPVAGTSAAASAPDKSSAGMGAAGGVAAAGRGAGVSAAGGGGAGGSGTGGAGGGGSPEMHADLGKGDGKDVVTIGDSWMQLFASGIEQSLDAASGHMYRHYAVPGTLVLNEQIPDQFKQAVAAGKDIKTVVMTGGGNDILTAGCSDAACNPIVDMVSQRLSKLMDDMKTAGVQDVVLIGYTYPADMTKRASLDHSRELSASICVPTGAPRCHYVDSTKLQIMLMSDGIHPTAASCDLIGKTVFDLMTKEGVRR
jgi:hypothetical protein